MAIVDHIYIVVAFANLLSRNGLVWVAAIVAVIVVVYGIAVQGIAYSVLLAN